MTLRPLPPFADGFWPSGWRPTAFERVDSQSVRVRAKRFIWTGEAVIERRHVCGADRWYWPNGLELTHAPAAVWSGINGALMSNAEASGPA